LTTFIDHRRRSLHLKYHSPDFNSGLAGVPNGLPHLSRLPGSGLANQ